nr:E3 ubiquitin-protein ligase BRE1-like 2 [Nicotiana tomentosiformis]
MAIRESDEETEENSYLHKRILNEEPGSSRLHEQVTSRLNITSNIISEVAENIENEFVLIGTIAGVEATESGKIGGKKKKKKRVPGTVKAHKKRKVASSIPVETPPTKGRATRSQRKQSETELERALKESKRKVAAKGKKKVSELVKAIEIEKIDLVLHDEDKAEEVKVVTPKGWKDMILQMEGRLAREEIVEFMDNCEINNGRVTSVVKGAIAKAVYKSEMKHAHKVLFEFVNKVVLPRQERRHIATFMDLVLLECLDSGRQINWLGFIIELLNRESGSNDTEIERLKKRLSEVETERDALRAELAKEKEKNEGILHDMLKLFQARNQEPVLFQP